MRFFRRYLSLIGLAVTCAGCATTIAGNYSHLDRRAVCVLPREIESDATEYIFTENNVPISNLHPEIVERVAPNARTVFEYDPDADPDSPQYLPVPYNELKCPDRFSILRSQNPATPPLPEAALGLSTYQKPLAGEPVPEPVAKQLATCPSAHGARFGARFGALSYSMKFNVYINEKGEAVSALVKQSTLDDDEMAACMLDVLRKTKWSVPEEAPVVAALGARMFLAQPAQPVPVVEPAPGIGDRPSGIYPKQAPQSGPKGAPFPFLGALPYMTPLMASGIVGITILVWPRETAPHWLDEINPITRRPYISQDEYETVRRLSPEDIARMQRQEAIKAAQSQPPPAPAPPPAPIAPPAPQSAPQKQPPPEKPDKCPKIKQEIFELIYAKRDATPKGGYPQGYQGLARRWEEYATNLGKWGYTLEGKLGRKAENHLAEYNIHRNRLKQKLDTEWENNQCDDKGHTLPDNTRQYAAQEPQLGPGKPLGPAPTPIHPRPSRPAAGVPQVKKPAK